VGAADAVKVEGAVVVVVVAAVVVAVVAVTVVWVMKGDVSVTGTASAVPPSRVLTQQRRGVVTGYEYAQAGSCSRGVAHALRYSR
jgi:hypothetical protein